MLCYNVCFDIMLKVVSGYVNIVVCMRNKDDYRYFRDNSLISVRQSGFIPGHSTVTHLVEMYHNICQATSEGKEIRVVFFDVSRAFDRVTPGVSI